MKKAFTLLILILFVSCGIPYDGQTIVEVELNIVDSNNNPIENQDISAIINDGFENNVGSIFTKKTDINGTLNFKIFKPNYDFGIDTSENLNYLPVSLINIDNDNFVNYNLNIGKLVLLKSDEITPFTITLNPISNAVYIQKIEVNAIKYERIINKSSILDNDSQEVLTNFELKKNQNFILKYTVKNNTTNSVVTLQENLTIGENPYNYTLNY